MAYDYTADGRLETLAGSGFDLGLENLLTYLNLPDTGDDAGDEQLLHLFLPAAWLICEAFCNRNVVPNGEILMEVQHRLDNPDLYDPDDQAGPIKHLMVADRRFVQAVLLTLADLYAQREDSSDVRTYRVVNSAHALLWPLRKGLGI